MEVEQRPGEAVGLQVMEAADPKGLFEDLVVGLQILTVVVEMKGLLE